MNQRDKLLAYLPAHCAKLGRRTFTLADLKDDTLYERLEIKSNTPEASIRRLLQELRDDEILRFHDNKGTYTLQYSVPVPGEIDEDLIGRAYDNDLGHKEYLVEVHARPRGLFGEALELLGRQCMVSSCENSFTDRRSGKPYIELHHIVNLCEGGEDVMDNLAVVCPYHHRKAHSADEASRTRLRSVLQSKTRMALS